MFLSCVVNTALILFLYHKYDECEDNDLIPKLKINNTKKSRTLMNGTLIGYAVMSRYASA